jgi:hypothetical protein
LNDDEDSVLNGASGADAAATAFLLDVKGAQVREALGAAGIGSVLLKGPAFARLLYDAPESRGYFDIDLLIDSCRERDAQHVLSALGFRLLAPGSPSAQTNPALGQKVQAVGGVYASTWLRPSDDLVVDLHRSLPQVHVNESRVWSALTGHLEATMIGGAPTYVLDRPATAMLVALHAANHGPTGERAVSDLQRAVEVFDLECWNQARAIASTLEAVDSMAAGLSLTPEGCRVAKELGLVPMASAALRLLWAGAPWSVSYLDSLLAKRGVSARAIMVAEALWPTAASMRRGSSLARRGRMGLVLAYLVRTMQLASRLPSVWSARRRHRHSR